MGASPSAGACLAFVCVTAWAVATWAHHVGTPRGHTTWAHWGWVAVYEEIGACVFPGVAVVHDQGLHCSNPLNNA